MGLELGKGHIHVHHVQSTSGWRPWRRDSNLDQLAACLRRHQTVGRRRGSTGHLQNTSLDERNPPPLSSKASLHSAPHLPSSRFTYLLSPGLSVDRKQSIRNNILSVCPYSHRILCVIVGQFNRNKCFFPPVVLFWNAIAAVQRNVSSSSCNSARQDRSAPKFQNRNVSLPNCLENRRSTILFFNLEKPVYSFLSQQRRVVLTWSE